MKTLPLSNQKKQLGFSLVELILVILVAGMIIMVLSNLTPTFNLLNTSSRENISRQIVSKKIEDMRALGYDNLANGTANFSDSRLLELPQASATTIIEDCPVDICANNEPIKQVTIQVKWTENSGQKDFSITTLIAKGGLR
jgi:type II secretory pathway pseudopilin PulG